MSLATRCAACGTVFRVVQDQLKVSEGWVRCGRCGDVFNALEGLFDLERETAPAWTPSQRGALDLLPSSADEHAAQSAAAAAEPARQKGGYDELPADDDIAEDTLIDTRADSRADSQSDIPAAERDVLDDDAVGVGEGSAFDEVAADEAAVDAPAPAELAPGFLRHAERAEFWQRPRMRRAFVAAAAGLGVLLALQVLLQRRDSLAARWPQAAPILAALCGPLGCRIEPLRHLDGLAVDSSGLTQLASPSLYRLQVTLRNRDAYPLLTPSLDVTLTDSRGDVISRRAIGPRELGAAAPMSVAAGAEAALQVVLDAGERRISGYNVEIFYP